VHTLLLCGCRSSSLAVTLGWTVAVCEPAPPQTSQSCAGACASVSPHQPSHRGGSYGTVVGLGAGGENRAVGVSPRGRVLDKGGGGARPGQGRRSDENDAEIFVALR
jgi:hypothetical protein